MTPYYVSTLSRWAIVDAENAREAIAEVESDPLARDVLAGAELRTVRPATDEELADWVGHWARVRREVQNQRFRALSEFLRNQRQFAKTSAYL